MNNQESRIRNLENQLVALTERVNRMRSFNRSSEHAEILSRLNTLERRSPLWPPKSPLCGEYIATVNARDFPCERMNGHTGLHYATYAATVVTKHE